MQAVLFDLDGTIVYSHPVHFTAYRKLFEELGIKWSHEEFERVFLIKGSRDIIRSVLEQNGLTNIDPENLLDRKKEIFRSLTSESPLDTVPGFFEFLGEIKRRNLKKAIASGSDTQSIKRMLSSIGALDEFPVLVSSATDVATVLYPKPAPNIFLRAAELLDVPPAECLVIEDTIFGVQAAASAGMRCVAFTTTCKDVSALKNAGANLVADDYRGIDLEVLKNKFS